MRKSLDRAVLKRAFRDRIVMLLPYKLLPSEISAEKLLAFEFALKSELLPPSSSFVMSISGSEIN